MANNFSAAAAWAGLTAFVWYAFGAVPLHIGVSEQLGLTTAQTSSWIFIVWFTGALATIAISLYFRQPIPITWTIPGLIFLGTLADRFSFAELVGANLVAGVLLLALGLLGVGGRIMAWLPLPIIMGMFAGSILPYVMRMVTASVEDIAVAGTAVAGYLLGRLIANPHVPPVGLAVVAGGIAIATGGTVATEPVSGRYWAAVISAALTVVLALAATPVASLLNVLPRTYIFALAGLAILASLQDALEKSFGGELRFGALVGFVVAATPFTLLGVSSAFWAIVAGVLASSLVERRQLLEFWRRSRAVRS